MQGRVGVATDYVCLSAKIIFVALENKSATRSECGSESNCRDEYEKDDKSLHKAYEKISAPWIKVCASNRALNSEIQVLRDQNEKAKGKISENIAC